MSKLPEFNTIVLKDTAFNNMMSNHIYNMAFPPHPDLPR